MSDGTEQLKGKKLQRTGPVKILRTDGDEEPNQRKRPAYSGIKEAIYKKIENGLT